MFCEITEHLADIHSLCNYLRLWHNMQLYFTTPRITEVVTNTHVQDIDLRD